jgi:hypothetical protein
VFVQNTEKMLREKYQIEFSELEPDYRLSDGNSKLKKSGIVSFNLIPIVHCPMAGSCKAFCYATVGQQSFKSGVVRRAKAFKATMQEDFVERMVLEIKKVSKWVKAVRVHDSGDFYSMDYLRKWIEIVKQFPDIKFYAYTKSLPFIHRAYDLQMIPDNFRLIQSVGGVGDRTIREDLPHAKIFSSLEELIAAGYDDASETDDAAAFGTNHRVGLVVHGAKKRKFDRKAQDEFGSKTA